MSRTNSTGSERSHAADTAMRQEQEQVTGSVGKQAHAPKLKVAIVHDWLVGGGAERVVEQLHKMYPEAPIYTSYCSDEWRKKLDDKVVTGYLQHWPFSGLRKFIPILRIWWFTHLDFSGYDLVISSSGNGEAKGVRTSKDTLHVCYCHSPTHFYWRHYYQYLKNPGFGVLNPLARLGLKILAGPLRRWDYKAAQRPNYFIANSNHIKKDIQKYYDRDAVVIHPPVDTDRFKKVDQKKREGFVTVGRQVPFKHTDIIVDACRKLFKPLKVIGRGPEHAKLIKKIDSSISFDEHASDDAVNNYLANAEAFIFAAHEDFGITPVEAMAAGTPIIAYKAGGALDYVNKSTGVFFDEQTSESLQKALVSFNASKFDHREIKKEAEKFSVVNFQKNIREFLHLVTNKEKK